MLDRLRRLFDRHPIRRRAVLIGVLAEVAIILAAAGVAPETVDQVHVIGGSAINIGALVGMVNTSEPNVTPMADPRDNDGRPLVPADTYAEPGR